MMPLLSMTIPSSDDWHRGYYATTYLRIEGIDSRLFLISKPKKNKAKDFTSLRAIVVEKTKI
jgi:hypothetical protein